MKMSFLWQKLWMPGNGQTNYFFSWINYYLQLSGNSSVLFHFFMTCWCVFREAVPELSVICVQFPKVFGYESLQELDVCASSRFREAPWPCFSPSFRFLLTPDTCLKSALPALLAPASSCCSLSLPTWSPLVPVCVLWPQRSLSHPEQPGCWPECAQHSVESHCWLPLGRQMLQVSNL